MLTQSVDASSERASVLGSEPMATSALMRAVVASIVTRLLANLGAVPGTVA
jgi:hypothetical protein